LEEITDESITSYPVWEKPYDANRHRIPVRKEYFLLAITID
jgi:hypothetical protein